MRALATLLIIGATPACSAAEPAGVLKHQQSALGSSSTLQALEKMRDELTGTDDCHERTRQVLLSSISSGGGSCQSECTKLELTLALSNCVLGTQRQAPIGCRVHESEGHCILAEGCLTAPLSQTSNLGAFTKRVLGGGWGSGVSEAAGEGEYEHYEPPALFNTPTQQSIVFDSSYRHIDSVCVYLSSMALVDASADFARATHDASKETLAMMKKAGDTGRQSLEVSASTAVLSYLACDARLVSCSRSLVHFMGM